MDFIIAPLITFIVFASIYGLFELFVRRRERMAIIEKLGDKFEPSMIEGKLNFGTLGGKRFSFGGLKIACLMIGIGLGFLIGFVINGIYIPGYVSGETGYVSDVISIIYGACLFVFGGLGLLVAFLAELKHSRKENK